jgi:hypothetical protein
MMNGRFALPRDERILQLMADRATEGLSHSDALELNRYLEQNPGVDRDALEYAAAVVCLAFGAGCGEALPSRVREKILSQAAW